MAPIEAQEVEIMEGMVKGTLVQKAPLNINLEEVRRITTPTRVMLNATTVISMDIMQVNFGRNRVMS